MIFRYCPRCAAELAEAISGGRLRPVCPSCGYVYYRTNVHNPRQHTVGIWYEGFVEHGDLLAGDDLDAVDYFSLDEPFPPLAFPTDELVLKELQQAIQT